ncbi:MAG: hypothetical protein GKR89_01905 [Candidatus Latescibacteria bacterium]|nr:hypothetical protein [Candidatus Latescibacterota bacterium]
MFDRNYQPTAKGKLVADTFFTINEEPPELRDRRLLAGGRIYERHFVKPRIIGASKDNPLRGMTGNGTTTIIYRGASIEEPITPDNIVYQYAVGEYANEMGDVIFMFFEYRPPAPPQMTISFAAGRFAGLKGRGMWYWTWPDHLEKPPVDQPYDSLNAYEMTFEWPDTQATNTSVNYEDCYYPSYIYDSRLADRQSLYYCSEPSHLNVTTKLSGGMMYNRHFVNGKLMPKNPHSPAQGMLSAAHTAICFHGDSEDQLAVDKLIYQHSAIDFFNDDGDCVLIFGEYAPPVKPMLYVMEGGGKLAGLKGKGQWYWTWPEGVEKPPVIEGYAYANAFDFDYILTGDGDPQGQSPGA